MSRVINTDRAHAHDIAIASLQAKGKRDVEVERRRVKCLNRHLEGDRGRQDRLVTPTLGFKSMKTAYATLKGFEAWARSGRARRERGRCSAASCGRGAPDRTSLRSWRQRSIGYRRESRSTPRQSVDGKRDAARALVARPVCYRASGLIIAARLPVF